MGIKSLTLLLFSVLLISFDKKQKLPLVQIDNIPPYQAIATKIGKYIDF